MPNDQFGATAVPRFRTHFSRNAPAHPPERETRQRQAQHDEQRGLVDLEGPVAVRRLIGKEQVKPRRDTLNTGLHAVVGARSTMRSTGEAPNTLNWPGELRTRAT